MMPKSVNVPESPGSDMHVIPWKRLNEFAARHPETRSALEHWYREMKRRNFASFAELRSVFPTADQAGKLTVFNIGGNRARLDTSRGPRPVRFQKPAAGGACARAGQGRRRGRPRPSRPTCTGLGGSARGPSPRLARGDGPLGSSRSTAQLLGVVSPACPGGAPERPGGRQVHALRPAAG